MTNDTEQRLELRIPGQTPKPLSGKQDKRRAITIIRLETTRAELRPRRPPSPTARANAHVPGNGARAPPSRPDATSPSPRPRSAAHQPHRYERPTAPARRRPRATSAATPARRSAHPRRSPAQTRFTTLPGSIATITDQILGLLTVAEQELQAMLGLRAGRLRLGAFSTAGAVLVPRAVKAFRDRYPDVEVRLIELDPEGSLQQLRLREIDLALVYQFPVEELPLSEVEYITVLDDRLKHRAAARPSFRLAQARQARRSRRRVVDTRCLPRLDDAGRPGGLPRGWIRTEHRLSERRPHGRARIGCRRSRRCGRTATDPRDGARRHRHPPARSRRRPAHAADQRRGTHEPLPRAGGGRDARDHQRSLRSSRRRATADDPRARPRWATDKPPSLVRGPGLSAQRVAVQSPTRMTPGNAGRDEEVG
jgi:LysR substrate binding domain-containing protein